MTTTTTKTTAKAKDTIRTTVIKGVADTIASNRRELEDGYAEYYQTAGDGGLIQPPYDLKRLSEFVQVNNTLGPCIEAMVNNIDGTGYEIERRDGDPMEESDLAAIKPATEFFDECAPRMSFKTLRKKVRRDAETTGQGYIEVMRSGDDRLVFTGYIDASTVRMGKLGEAVPVVETVMRGGREEKFTVLKRERRYAQRVGEKMIWFAEYGASRQLDKFTGQWQLPGVKLPTERRATELLAFGIDPDVTTPYCVPRWINQIPSVLGSRKAEEHNLEFFNSGGIPPYLVIVQGGQLAEKTVQAVRDALNQKDAHARVQVIEAFSTSGDLNSSSNVQVKVERFGAERSNDAMFAQYDKDTEARVRKSFRIPPILIGKSEDYNYASAHASYLVAEAQVFKPERDEFDEIITSTLLYELLGTNDYVFRSKPISIVDAATQLSAIKTAITTKKADAEHLLTMVGEVAGMEFKVSDEEFDEEGNPIPKTAGVKVKKPKPKDGDPTSSASSKKVVSIDDARKKKATAKSEDLAELFSGLNPDLVATALAAMTCGQASADRTV